MNRGFADTMIDAARKAGARSGTVFCAGGTGVHETEKFFAVSIQPEKEVVMTLVKKEETQNIMEHIVNAAGLRTEGKGLSLALPVSNVAGISAYSEGFREEEEGSDHV